MIAAAAIFVVFLGQVSLPASAAVTLKDGSRLHCIILQSSLEIETRYGKLTIPVKDIRLVEFGSHFADEMKVQAALADLGLDNHASRDVAQKYLQGVGPAIYPLLLIAAKDKDLETKRRAELLVRWYQAQHSKERLKLSPDDVIATDDLKIGGRILGTTLKAKSLLGDLDLKLCDLLRMTIQPAGKSQVFLDGTKIGEWVDTGILVAPDEWAHVDADGSVDLWTASPGQYVCGPGGLNSAAGLKSNLPAGALVMKLGVDGEEYRMGSLRAKEYSRLWLRIVPSSWPNGATAGGYSVKVRVE